MHPHRFRLVLALGITTLFILASASLTHAQGPVATQVENQVCLACHTNRNLTLKLPNGEILSMYIDEAQYNASVHGKVGQRCTTCHPNITAYPH
ncbi:MAG: hypothetical protein N2559_14520, partial [Anaerolineae bacterium]|nr:hypothetical protein [Anaerolineae bacterium]